MKATKIYFERTKTYSGFNNRKVGIELQIGKGETAKDAMDKAEIFVANQLGESITPQQISSALGR